LLDLKQKLSFHLKLFWTFFKIGAFVFGGGLAMIPIIQKEIVDIHKWMSEEEFIDMFAVTQSAPGPIAVNSAVFIGYKLAGLFGAITALLGTVIPSFVIILLFALFLSAKQDNPYLHNFFAGVRPAVIALILGAGLKMGQKVIHSSFELLLGILALCLLLLFRVHPFVLIILSALFGILYNHYTQRETKEGSS
jgi:chromate transporter